MSQPINEIFYFSIGIIDSIGSLNFENNLDANWGLSVAICGINNEYIVLESKGVEARIFKNNGFIKSLDEYHKLGLIDLSMNPDFVNILISSYNDIASDEYCAKNKNYFYSDSEESIETFSPCFFVLCDKVSEFEGCFYNPDYFEITYDTDKLFSLYDLFGRLNQFRNNVYGVKV